MPSWKKVLVSGSDASLNSLQVSTFLTAPEISGSFSGSFQGNGSRLTDIVSSSYAVTSSYSNFATTASFALNVSANVDWDLIINKPVGLVSSSAQIDYLQISNVPSGILSSSSQIASDISGAFTSVSSSIASDITGLDTRIDTLEGKTLVSGSSQIILQDTTGDLSGSRIVGLVTSASYAITASNAILFNGFPSSHYAVTGSNSFSGSQTIYGNLNVTQQFTASGLNYPTTDGLYGVEVLQTDGAGNLTLEIPETLYEEVKNNDVVTLVKGTPVKVVGSVGNQALIVKADAGNPALMPASYVLAQDLAPQAEGLGVVLGKITGVNTAGFTAGEVVYVGVGGGYTQIRPTGSAQVQPLGFPVKIGTNGGSGVIMNPGVSNDLPNLTQGYLWVGGTGSVPTTIASSSFAKVGENNTFTGTQTFTNIVVNGTGSFSYIESVTGSAKIIGDAFIILNNNLPAEPYGGIKVIDSGSTNITASLLWDGITNHWVYENVSGSTYGAAGLMAGPRSTGLDNILYPTQYKVLRSQGGDHIYDSNITDNDSLVSITIPLSVTGDITSSTDIKAGGNFIGNVIGNASSANTASYVEYSNVANKPTLISSSIQVDYLGLSNIPANIVSSSLQIATEISGAFTSISSSIAIDITSLDGRLDTLEGKTLLSSSIQIASEISGAFTSVSSSIALDITSVDGRLDVLEGKTLISSSLQIANEISGAFTSVSSSIAIDLTSVDGRLDVLESKTLLSSSLQIASEISGAFTDLSSSFNTRISSLENFSSSLDSTFATDSELSSVSSSLASTVTGLDSRLDSLESKTLLSSSLQIASEISGAFTSTSSSFAFDVTSIDGRLDSLESKTLISSSFQIAAEISGAFTSTSSSLAIDLTSVDGRLDFLEGKTLVSSSTQITYNSITGIPAGIISSSTQLDNTTLTGMSISGSFSGSFQGDGSGLTNVPVSINTSSFATTGSNVFTSTQVVYGNIDASGVVSSAIARTNAFITPKIIYNSFVIPAEHNGVIFGPVDITGSMNIQPGSDVIIFDQSDYAKQQSFDEVSGSFVTLNSKTLLSSSAQVKLDEIEGTFFKNATYTFPHNLEVFGKLNVREFTSKLISSSIIYESGSTKFGDSPDDVHSFTGSIRVQGNIIGQLVGTASTASYFDLTSTGILSSSLQIASEISGAYSSTSSSIAIDISSLDSRLDSIEAISIISSSNQLTSSLDNRYVLSGSITQTTWDNIANKPLGIVSSSNQINLDQINGINFGNYSYVFPLDLTIQGRLTAQEYITEIVSASIIYESGSTKFGDTSDDRHSFTGSLEVLGGITGSLLGTASNVDYNNISNLPNLISSSGQIATEVSGAFTSTSSSLASSIDGLDSRLDSIESKTLISGSSQVSYTQLSDIPSGIISGSSQLDGSVLTNVTVTGSFTGSFIGDGSQLTGIQTGLDELQVVLLSQFFG